MGDIASWNHDDASGLRRSSVARGANIVVDLISAASAAQPAFDAVLPHVISTTADPVTHLLALPGLLRALRREPIGGFVGDPMDSVDPHRASVHALVTLTPVDRAAPDLADPDLTGRVARGRRDLATAAVSIRVGTGAQRTASTWPCANSLSGEQALPPRG
ncbi:hypothetical protein ACFXPA_46060 [Amycolatopsis sp. NPDC059090]|uniref:hypothetical protein n=1 Tax=Amycolatopsis sp. NPDC059090 TaxID=3346723 RepID=UPI00366CEF06